MKKKTYQRDGRESIYRKIKLKISNGNEKESEKVRQRMKEE
jgi:hypothetical protein